MRALDAMRDMAYVADGAALRGKGLRTTLPDGCMPDSFFLFRTSR